MSTKSHFLYLVFFGLCLLSLTHVLVFVIRDPTAVPSGGDAPILANAITSAVPINTTGTGPRTSPRNPVHVVSSPRVPVDSLVYFNSFVNPLRHAFMEGWIGQQQQQLQQNALSFKVFRCEPTNANKTGSIKWKLMLGHGLGRSYQRLRYVLPDMDNITTVVLHDDATQIDDMARLEIALAKLPDDWNVARLQCRQNRSHAIAYRNTSLKTLIQLMPHEQGDDIHRLLHRHNGTKFQVYCVNLGITRQVPCPQEPPNHVVEAVWFTNAFDTRVSETEIRKIEPPLNANTDARIDKIIYHNLARNQLRRKSMEHWLSEQPIPYTRAEGLTGNTTGCASNIQTEARCRGVSGLLFTLVHIIDHYNMTGTTLILEDDIIIVDKYLERLELALPLVPDDWDIIRFDTWGVNWTSYGSFEFQSVNDYVLNTTTYDIGTPCAETVWEGPCQLFGGTYAMLFREQSVHKLRDLWSKPPYGDADGAISDGTGSNGIRSYSLQIGIFEHRLLKSEFSQISLHEGGHLDENGTEKKKKNGNGTEKKKKKEKKQRKSIS
jgi:hypothetical protein